MSKFIRTSLSHALFYGGGIAICALIFLTTAPAQAQLPCETEAGCLPQSPWSITFPTTTYMLPGGCKARIFYKRRYNACLVQNEVMVDHIEFDPSTQTQCSTYASSTVTSYIMAFAIDSLIRAEMKNPVGVFQFPIPPDQDNNTIVKIFMGACWKYCRGERTEGTRHDDDPTIARTDKAKGGAQSVPMIPNDMYIPCGNVCCTRTYTVIRDANNNLIVTSVRNNTPTTACTGWNIYDDQPCIYTSSPCLNVCEEIE